MGINLYLTEEAIRKISFRLRESADKLDTIASKLIARNDLEYVADAIQEIVSCFSSLRIDLLYTRPLREIMRDKE